MKYTGQPKPAVKTTLQVRLLVHMTAWPSGVTHPMRPILRGYLQIQMPSIPILRSISRLLLTITTVSVEITMKSGWQKKDSVTFTCLMMDQIAARCGKNYFVWIQLFVYSHWLSLVWIMTQVSFKYQLSRFASLVDTTNQRRESSWELLFPWLWCR